MEVTITSRHCSVSDSIREQVAQRLNESISKLKDRVIRTEVEFTANPAKGSPDDDIRCEITMRGKGPVVRAGASASDKIIAFDKAEEKLKNQLRKAADRRKQRRDLRGRGLETMPIDLGWVEPNDQTQPQVPTEVIAGMEVTGDGPLVVREKVFETAPLTLAQALDEMELVGHDFFLYLDAESKQPSVVYRRKAYDYGVIHLNVVTEPAG